MAQVPYQPVPDVLPRDESIPKISVDAPIEAFGGAVAQGLSHLGTAVEGAGNELYARAYALQQLNNEAEARDKDSDYMIAAGQLHADFNALEGKQRVDAYPAYSKNLQDLRTKMRGELSNPAAAKMFDASSLSTMGRTIFNGAGAAAAANKDYSITSIKSQLDLDAQTVGDNPNDPTLFEEKLRRIDQNAAVLAGAQHGADPDSPQALDIAAKLKSHLAASRVLGMARNQPFQASQLLTEYKGKGLLREDDLNTLEGKVQGFAQTVGASAIAQNVMDQYKQPDGNYSKSFDAMQAEAGKKAMGMYPDDPKMEFAAKAALDRQFNQVKYARRVDGQDRQAQIASYLTKGVDNIDLLPKSLVDQMTPQEIRDFPGQANRYRHARETATSDKQKDWLQGLYQNDNATFMNTDVTRVPGLSNGDMNHFLMLQRKATVNGDPRVGKAMSDIKTFAPAALDALGITGPRLDRDVRNQFTGALHSAVQGWQEQYGKPPGPKDLQDVIYPSLMRKVAEPGKIWGTNQVEFFRSQLPPEVVKETESELKRDATEDELEQVRNDYMRKQFNQFYKTSAGTKSEVNRRFP